MTTSSRAPALPLPLPIFCPIEPRIHPQAKDIEERSIEWLAGYDYFVGPGGRERLLGTNSAEFAARVTPDALTERLQMASDWDYLGFAFDDAFCDSGPMSTDPARFMRHANRIIRMLEAPRDMPATDHDPYMTALADISARFAACVTPTQHRRWVLAHRAWLFGVAAQISTAATPGLDDYLTIRVNNAAGEVVTATGELAAGDEVPAHEMDLPAVRALTEMCRVLAALDNDLHSYRKTTSQHESNQQNLVTVLATEQGRGLGPAANAAVGIRDRIMCRFLILREQLTATPGMGAPARAYVQSLGHVIRGNIDWALNVPRYTVDGTTAGDTVIWTEYPADSCPSAPPLPSIAWWWDRDL
jgi:hypothetical protein